MKNKKNILIFTDWYLPGYKAGGPIKSISSMVSLLKEDFNFFIVTRDTDVGEKVPYVGIKPNTWTELESKEKVMYLSETKIKTILKISKQNNIHLIYCNSLFSVYFSILPIVLYQLGKIKTPILLAPRGMLGEGALKIKPIKKRLFLYSIKLFQIHQSIFWHATSNQEKNEIIKNFGKKLKMFNVGNLQLIDKTNTSISITKKKNEVRFLFLSRISEKKNLLFALNCLDEIAVSNNKIIFDIAGPIEDRVYWKKCENTIALLREKEINVNYLGAVKSEKVKETIINYHFLFLPTLNENFGHVIVEAFFASRPVIISDQTPWRNLNTYKAGWDLSLNDKVAFKNVLLECMDMENDVFQQMSQAAYKFAKENCKFEEDKEKTVKMFHSIINNEPSKSE